MTGTGQRPGQTWTRAARARAFALAVVTAPGPSAAAEIASVPLPTAGRTPLLEVMIGGTGPFRLMVDPGNETLISERVLEEIGSTSAEAGSVVLENVVIGGVQLGTVEAGSWQPRPIMPGGPTFDGFIALSVLSDYVVTLDYARERFVIETGALPEADGREVLEYALNEEGAVTVEIRIGEETHFARMDAGAIGHLSLPLRDADRLPLAGEPARIGRSITDDGREVEILGTRLDGDARIGSHVLERPGLELSEAFTRTMLGFDALSHLAITFDQKNHRVRVRASEDHATFLQRKAAAVASLDPDAPPLRAFFNEHEKRVHLMVLLSPT